MNSQDQVRFKELISIISENYDHDFTPSTVKLWWSVFKPHSIEAFESAVFSHIACPNVGMFAPKPANVMAHIVGTEKQVLIESKDRAEIAWNVIVGEISRIGSYGTLKLDDGQALAAVKAIGGWKNLCSMTADKLTWAKKEFLAAYGSYERTPVELLPSKLPGRIAIENQKLERSKNGVGLKAVLENLKLNQGGGNG